MSFVLLLLEGTILGKVSEFDHDWRMATMLIGVTAARLYCTTVDWQSVWSGARLW